MPKKKPDRRLAAATTGTDQRKGTRRASERIVLDVPVDLERDGTYLYSYITDLSAVGVFVLTNAHHPVGTRLRIHFKLPGESQPLALDSEAQWTSQPRPPH